MRDRRTKRPGAGLLDVDVNPLVIVGRVGEQIDAVLRDRQPLAAAERMTNGGEYGINRINYGCTHFQALWLDADTVSRTRQDDYSAARNTITLATSKASAPRPNASRLARPLSTTSDALLRSYYRNTLTADPPTCRTPHTQEKRREG